MIEASSDLEILAAFFDVRYTLLTSLYSKQLSLYHAAGLKTKGRSPIQPKTCTTKPAGNFQHSVSVFWAFGGNDSCTQQLLPSSNLCSLLLFTGDTANVTMVHTTGQN